jgi:amino acid transporter
MTSGPPPADAPRMERSLGLLQAVALNVSNMVGIGPFITIPLFIAAMGGPQAMIAWVIAAVLVLCDGLVWSELGAAFPGSGGTYHYLREAYASTRFGRLLPFLFIWQFLFTGTLEIASGYLGATAYLSYIFPGLVKSLEEYGIADAKPVVCACSALAVTLLLSRRTRTIGWLGVAFFVGTLFTVLWVIFAGVMHFDASLLTFPENAFTLNAAWFVGLAGAMRIAIYDYLGYYNICHLGDEVRAPEKTIPRAILISVAIIAAVYLTMNVSIIAVVPWQEAMKSENIAALFMERLYGRPTAVLFTWLVLWTAAACVFAITLGYSRIPYAAARGGDFFPAFGRLHPRHGYPRAALWTIGILSAVFCFFPLDLVIESAVTIRIGVQFLGQIIGLHVLRKTRPGVPLPFRMWLYPLPSAIAFIGWMFVLSMPHSKYGWQPLGLMAAVYASGVIAFAIWNQVARPSNGAATNPLEPEA